MGCAQGSWGSEGACKGVKSALASFGSRSYVAYTVDAYANTWVGRLGFDGFTEDCSGNYPCMFQVRPSTTSLFSPDVHYITCRMSHPPLLLTKLLTKRHV